MSHPSPFGAENVAVAIFGHLIGSLYMIRSVFLSFAIIFKKMAYYPVDEYTVIVLSLVVWGIADLVICVPQCLLMQVPRPSWPLTNGNSN